MTRSDKIGQQVGDYRLIRLLGSGGFGEVYLAEDSQALQQVAIKLLSTKLSQKDEWHEFLNEARLFRLKHPHIVQLLDFGISDEDQPFLVMEYAPHGTLRLRHPRGTRVTLERVVEYVESIASALQYAHERRLIHRDVKPENILLGTNEQILLSDFGIVTVAHSSRSLDATKVLGTPAYMAPEQLQGKPRPSSDQYALAIMAYEWLAGIRPFNGTYPELISQHTMASPPPLCEQVHNLPTEVEQVIFIALAKDPKARFATVRAFAQAFTQAARPVFTTGTTPLPSTQIHPSSSHPVIQKPSPIRTPSTPASLTSEPVQATPATPPLSEGESSPAKAHHSTEIHTPAFSFSSSPTSPPERSQQRRPSRRATMIISMLLVLLFVSSGLVWIAFSLRASHTQSDATATTQAATTATIVAHAHATATVLAGYASATATIKESFTAYDTNVATQGIMYGFDAQHTRFNLYERLLGVQNIAQLVQYWSSSAGNGFVAPTVVGGIVYVLDRGGQLRAYSAEGCQSQECTPLWSSKAVSQSSDTSPLAVSNGIVYINADFKLHAYKADGCGQAECDPLWTSKEGQIDQSEPVIVDNSVYVGGNNGRLYAYSALGCGAQNCPPLWSTQLGSGSIPEEAGSAPAVANGILYIVPYDGVLYAYNLAACERSTACSPLWSTPQRTNVAAFSSPTVANGLVYFGGDDGVFYAYKADGCGKSVCTPVWTARTTTDYIGSSPAIANGVVYIGASGILYALKADGCGSAQCMPLWTANIGGTYNTEITIANGVVYVGSDGGTLYAFPTIGCGQKQCQALWSTAINAGTPAIANGVLYVSSPSRLYAFHLG